MMFSWRGAIFPFLPRRQKAAAAALVYIASFCIPFNGKLKPLSVYMHTKEKWDFSLFLN